MRGTGDCACTIWSWVVIRSTRIESFYRIASHCIALLGLLTATPPVYTIASLRARSSSSLLSSSTASLTCSATPISWWMSAVRSHWLRSRQTKSKEAARSWSSWSMLKC